VIVMMLKTVRIVKTMSLKRWQSTIRSELG
jgi:hypothetical protein